MEPQKNPSPPQSPLPATFKAFIQKFAALGEAHEQVAKAVDAAGPLDRKTCELIKVGICIGGGLESAGLVAFMPCGCSEHYGLAPFVIGVCGQDDAAQCRTAQVRTVADILAILC